jgi:hypothetical protein
MMMTPGPAELCDLEDRLVEAMQSASSLYPIQTFHLVAVSRAGQEKTVSVDHPEDYGSWRQIAKALLGVARRVVDRRPDLVRLEARICGLNDRCVTCCLDEVLRRRGSGALILRTARCTAPGCPETVPDRGYLGLAWTCPLHDACGAFEGCGDWCRRCGRGMRIHPVDGLTPDQCFLVLLARQREVDEVVLVVTRGRVQVGDRILAVDGDRWKEGGGFVWEIDTLKPGGLRIRWADGTEQSGVAPVDGWRARTGRYIVARPTHLTPRQLRVARTLWSHDVDVRVDRSSRRGSLAGSRVYVDREVESWE